METKVRTYFFWSLLVVVQAVWIANSDGFYFIDDSSHYNFNRHFIEQIGQSTGAWHRMGRVLLFALPAQFGLKGVQIASAILFIITIYFAYKILRHKNVRYAEWVIPIIGFQPVLFNVSYTSLAEVPAGFLIVLAYYLYLKEKTEWVLVTASLVFLFRTEYYYVAGLFVLIYAYQKKWKILPYVLVGPLLWYLYSTFITLNPIQFFYDMTLHSRLPKIDTGVDWYYYLLHSPKIYGFLQAIFFITGTVILAFKKQLKDYALVLIIVFTGIFIQTLFAMKELNLTCSIGQLRYIAVVGPMFGIVSASGISYLFGTIKNNAFRNTLMTIILLAMFALGPYATPYHNKFAIEKVSDDITELASKNYPEHKLLSNMHQLANATDEPQTGGERFKILNQTNVEKYNKSLIVWCSYLEGSPFVNENVTLDEINSIPNIKLVKEYKDTVNNCYSSPMYYKYRKEGDEFKSSRKFIDYLTADQTTWETFDIKVFLKE
ncbi:MAG: hypothetical protein L0Y79_02625 [Chlorobi bacterium]|nr:hypothetical protein [Chlorobiota bacterium]MCI0715958.1 hypothetical protein [Chlorobiota bacterium]